MDSNGVVRSSSPPPHDGIRKIRTAMRLFLVLVVFGGCVFLYFMIPTNTYKKIWMPRIRATANSSPYFGSQGTLIYIIKNLVLIFFSACSQLLRRSNSELCVFVTFAKSPALKYNPTSVMFINVPSISKLQWHSFTVSSNSNLETEMISVVLKGEGSWTKKLYQVLSSPSRIDRIEVAVEGSYGPAATNFLRHDNLVMVCGGSGITPFISIIRELIFMSTTNQCKLPKVTLICAFKHSSDLTMLDLILPISSTTAYDLSNLQIQIEAYVTRDAQPKDYPMNLRAIWFKPLATDEPVSAILGANHSLWLGLIIASSFMMFLILIGIITRFYIYPIDHNSNKIFPFPLRALFNMLAICISIAETAGATVLWNKRSIAKELKQVQHMETTSPRGSEVYNAERELKSFPQQSLVQSTNVHYGQRPDLKRILIECKGSSVGVLASGPKKMRHEVATICSSGLAENMHFESIRASPTATL